MATGSAVSRLAALGVVLPVPSGIPRPQVTIPVFCSLINPAAPVANYVPYVITGTDVHRVSFNCFFPPFFVGSY
jgi:hypothetical protein